jgi:hypothetical protein
MKNIWKYISIFLAGFSTMAIIALKWFNGDDYSLEIKKIKSRKSSGDIITPIEIEMPENGRKRGKNRVKRGKRRRIDKRSGK